MYRTAHNSEIQLIVQKKLFNDFRGIDLHLHLYLRVADSKSLNLSGEVVDTDVYAAAPA